MTWASVSSPSLPLHISETTVLQEALGSPPPQGGREGGAGTQGRNQALDRRLETAQTWRTWVVRTCVWCCEDMSASTPTCTRAASAQLQTPGCAARRNEVSLGESTLDSHTRPGGLISSTRLGLPQTGIFHGPSLAGWEGEQVMGEKVLLPLWPLCEPRFSLHRPTHTFPPMTREGALGGC